MSEYKPKHLRVEPDDFSIEDLIEKNEPETDDFEPEYEEEENWVRRIEDMQQEAKEERKAKKGLSDLKHKFFKH